MRFGYNTNGFAHHRLEDALTILAELGYESVAITLDHYALNPYDPDLPRQLTSVRALLRRLNLHCVIETGARFLLDPHHKHQPTLLSADETDRGRRLDYLKRAVDIARALETDVVSFWSGTALESAPRGVLLERLVGGYCRLRDYANRHEVRLALEPEPGMFIDTMSAFAELATRVNDAEFGLTIDIGHLQCMGDTPIPDILRQWRDLLWNVHIDDMRRGVHDHLLFGEGEIEFAPVLKTLDEIGYTGGVHVELSRHSHDAVETARRALAFLQAAAQR